MLNWTNIQMLRIQFFLCTSLPTHPRMFVYLTLERPSSTAMVTSSVQPFNTVSLVSERPNIFEGTKRLDVYQRLSG